MAITSPGVVVSWEDLKAAGEILKGMAEGEQRYVIKGEGEMAEEGGSILYPLREEWDRSSTAPYPWWAWTPEDASADLEGEGEMGERDFLDMEQEDLEATPGTKEPTSRWKCICGNTSFSIVRTVRYVHDFEFLCKACGQLWVWDE